MNVFDDKKLAKKAPCIISLLCMLLFLLLILKYGGASHFSIICAAGLHKNVSAISAYNFF